MAQLLNALQIVLLLSLMFLASSAQQQRFNELVSQRGHIELPLVFPNTRTFTLAPSQGTSPSSVTAQLGDAKCTFQYEVIFCSEISSKPKNEDTPNQKNSIGTAAAAETASFESYLDKLPKKGQLCLQASQEDWRYKVCLWDETVQSFQGGGDSFSLGKYSPEESKDNKMVFDNGDSCHSKPRKTIVSLFCGDADLITEISESPMCVYHISITLKSLCGQDSPFKRFAVSTVANGKQQQKNNKAEDTFMLQVERSSVEDSYSCSVLLTQIGAQSLQTTTTCFKNFALTISSSSSPENGPTKPWSLNSWTARKSNRKDFAEGEIESSSSRTGIRTSSLFRPSDLEFARVVASPSPSTDRIEPAQNGNDGQ